MKKLLPNRGVADKTKKSRPCAKDSTNHMTGIFQRRCINEKKKSHTRGGREKGVSQTPAAGENPHIQRKDAHIMSSASISYYIKREMSREKEHKNAKI